MLNKNWFVCCMFFFCYWLVVVGVVLLSHFFGGLGLDVVMETEESADVSVRSSPSLLAFATIFGNQKPSRRNKNLLTSFLVVFPTQNN